MIRFIPAFSSPLRSVETPVAKRPREATAKEPPRSTGRAILASRFIVSLLRRTYPCWQLCPHGGYSDDSGVISWSLFRSTIDTLTGWGTPLPYVPSGCPIQNWQSRVWQQSLEAGEASVKSVHVDSRVHSLSIEAIRRRSKAFNWR